MAGTGGVLCHRHVKVVQDDVTAGGPVENLLENPALGDRDRADYVGEHAAGGALQLHAAAAAAEQAAVEAAGRAAALAAAAANAPAVPGGVSTRLLETPTEAVSTTRPEISRPGLLQADDLLLALVQAELQLLGVLAELRKQNKQHAGRGLSTPRSEMAAEGRCSERPFALRERPTTSPGAGTSRGS